LSPDAGRFHADWQLLQTLAGNNVERLSISRNAQRQPTITMTFTLTTSAARNLYGVAKKHVTAGYRESKNLHSGT